MNILSTQKRIPWNKGKRGVQIAWNKGLTKQMDSRLNYERPTVFKIGIPNPKAPFKKGMVPWNKYTKGLSIGFPKGKHNTKISGENHYMWKGGITPLNRKIRHSLEYRIACADSKKRDNYICQMPGCGVRGGDLHSHHVKSFVGHPDLRFEINNLITLCVSCHRRVNRNEEKYEELFINIIKIK